MPLRKIISGAQTGVDRGALDSAISGEYYSWGGCVPKGRLAEDGELDSSYFDTESFGSGLVEHKESRDYASRTFRNIADSDATIILRFQGSGRVLGPGTKLTIKTLTNMKKPYKIFDPSKLYQIPDAVQWICETEIGDPPRLIEILNVAGSRESGSPGIYEASKVFMNEILSYVFTYQHWGLKIWSSETR